MFNEYEKVQDTILFLGSSFVLKFNVVLASKDKFGNRKFFYQEYSYQSKYNDTGKVISVKRQIKYYLTIEEMANFNNNILITQGDMPKLRGALTEAVKWLHSNEVFGINKGKHLVIMKDEMVQTPIGDSQALRFEPLVYPDQMGKEQKGIRMYINDMSNFVDLSERNFMSFYEICRGMNMYQAACAVIASLPMDHKDAAVNRTDFEAEAEQQRFDRMKPKKPGFFDNK